MLIYLKRFFFLASFHHSFLLLLEWTLISGLCTYKVGTLPLEPHIQSILLQLFWKWSLENYLFGMALNCDLSISSSQVARIISVNYQSPASIDHFYFSQIFHFIWISNIIHISFNLHLKNDCD
jgi:hypothetical protein